MTMTDKPDTALRGEAAWRAAKQRVADNNEAAFARAREEQAVRRERTVDRERAAARKEASELPHQPTPPAE
jgi:hypothetical protein